MILLEFPIQSVDANMLQDLRTKYPRAVVRVETEEPTYMDENQFWQLISLLDWKKETNDDIISPTVKALSQYSVNDITIFEDILAQKLYALDGQKYAEQTGDNQYSKDSKKYFSVDVFLYARCCVVANGKTFYEEVLHNPALMPKEHTFESILYLPEKAYRLKTGHSDYSHLPDVWIETFSNSTGWPGITPLKERILNAG